MWVGGPAYVINPQKPPSSLQPSDSCTLQKSIRGIRGIHGISRNSRGRDRDPLPSSFIFMELEMAIALHTHGSIATWPDAVAATRGGTMRSARPYADRLSSKPCSTREDLRRQKGRIEAPSAMRRTSKGPLWSRSNSTAMQNLEEDLMQISASRKLTCYAIQTHLTSRHSPTRGVRLAA
jgi:hypothetical protein